MDESWLDTRKVQFPRRDGAPVGGTTTPKKTHIGSGGGVMPSFLSMCVFAIFCTRKVFCAIIVPILKFNNGYTTGAVRIYDPLHYK